MTKHFHNEIRKLKKKILRLAAMVEQSLWCAVVSISNHDLKLAEEIIRNDSEIDSFEVEVEEECLKILALHQPVAADLRYVVASLKINSDLERIADLAVNIAERTITMSAYPNIKCPVDLESMLEVAMKMVKFSVDSLVNSDTEKAWKVIQDDDILDDKDSEVHKVVCEKIRRDSDNSNYYIGLLSVSRNLERIGDHATNIAEDVIYMIEGDIVRHQHPPEYYENKAAEIKTKK